MKHDITTINDGLWRIRVSDRGFGMDKASKSTQRRARELIDAIKYCAVCYVKLNDATGLVTLRPLVDSGERSSIPLRDRRVTMCSKHAAEAIEAKTHEAAASV